MAYLMLALFLNYLWLCSTALANDMIMDSAVRQEEGFISVNVGENVTLRCFYEGNVAALFFWYKQTLGQKPRLMSSFYKHNAKGTFKEEFKDNPRFTLGTRNNEYHLTILNVVPSDSATYYCISSYVYNFKFGEGTILSVQGSGLKIQAFIYQSVPDTVQPEEPMTCRVQPGICDGGHSLYWYRNVKESQPGLIYTQGGRNDQCEEEPSTSSCVYQGTLNRSQAGTFYCAIATCGQILFGIGPSLDLPADEEDSPDSLVYFLGGGLAFTTILLVLLTISLYETHKGSCFCSESQRVSASTTTNPEGSQSDENLHYAALRVQKANTSRKQRSDLWTECVYSGVIQQ